MLNSFRGENFFLSNFYEHPVRFEGMIFPNNEAAFQAAKTTDLEKRVPFQTMAPDEAKKAGRKIDLRPDWEDIKDAIMYLICAAKFSDSILRERLLTTGDEELVEGNYWHDNNFGDCFCGKCKNTVGKNVLGKILMRIREEFR